MTNAVLRAALVDRVDQRLLAHASDYCQVLGLSGLLAPSHDRLVGICVDYGDGRAALGEFRGQQYGGRRFSGSPLELAKEMVGMIFPLVSARTVRNRLSVNC